MYFQWSDRLDTGIVEIDSQHRAIADYINALYNAKQTNDQSEVEGVLSGLVDYTVNHFSFEEQLMEYTFSPIGKKSRPLDIGIKVLKCLLVLIKAKSRVRS